MMTNFKNQILTYQQVSAKSKRIAFEIYENNFEEKEIIIAGIFDNGYRFAELLQADLSLISTFKTTLIKVSLDKTFPLQTEITLDTDIQTLKDKVIILVDDVLNTGRTLAYSLKPFLNIEVKKIQTAVIVDRGYKSFPISADYVGYQLSTTINQHILVELKDQENSGVYLL